MKSFTESSHEQNFLSPPLPRCRGGAGLKKSTVQGVIFIIPVPVSFGFVLVRVRVPVPTMNNQCSITDNFIQSTRTINKFVACVPKCPALRNSVESSASSPPRLLALPC